MEETGTDETGQYVRTQSRQIYEIDALTLSTTVENNKSAGGGVLEGSSGYDGDISRDG